MGLNILIINLDSTLAVEEDNVVGSAKVRHIEYAKHLENLYIIVKTSKSIKRNIRKVKDNLFIYPSSSLNRYFFFYDAYNLASRICKKNRVDLISTQDPFITGLIGWLLKKKYNIPLNIQIHGDMIDNKYFIKESIFNLFFNTLAKQLIRKADTIRVGTSRQKEELVQLGIKDKKIWHIPSFINSGLFLQNDGQSTRRQYLSDKFDRLVLYVGRLAKEKNLETLIQTIPLIIKNYPKVLFLIIGQGPEEIKIKNFVLNLGVRDNVCFIGDISYDKISDFFSACDLFVITSVYEGTCMVLLEAAVSGKAIVSTSHAGAYDAIENGKTGFILNFKDVENISQKIIYLLKNPEIAKEMGEKGRKHVLENFDKDKILKDHLKMWWQTINYRNKTLGTIQKNKLWLIMLLKQLGILTYAKKIRRIYLSFVLKKRCCKFYIKTNTRKLENPPLSYCFEPTLQCNLKCHFCYQRDIKKEMSKEMSLEQIRQAFSILNLDDQVVNLTGGEIFVREDLFEILEYFKEKNIWCYMVTNGTLFGKDTVNKLLKYNIRGIGFSLDGPEDTHNQIRNSKDIFERVRKAIELTRDKFRVGLNCVIQEKNIDSLIDVVLITHNLKLKELNFQPEMFTTPKALEDAKQILGWDSLPVALQLKLNPVYNFPIEMWQAKWAEVKRIGKRLGMDINIHPFLFDRYPGICAQRRLRNSNLRLMCTALLISRIDPYGNVIPCHAIRKSFGNLLESSFEQIWNSQDFSEFRYNMAMNNLLPICENCCKLRLI